MFDPFIVEISNLSIENVQFVNLRMYVVVHVMYIYIVDGHLDWGRKKKLAENNILTM